MMLLLRRRRFLPLFLVQFLGAVNGNLCKNATIVLCLYRLAPAAAQTGSVLATLAAGMFVLPFLLFSATAGTWADGHDKARLIQASKALEIIACCVAFFAFQTGDARFLLAALFLLGSQAALFGPLKYGILPDHLPSAELLGANALVEASTFIAILAGTLIGSLTVLSEGGVRRVQIMLLALSLLGFLASLTIPPAPACAPLRGFPIRPLADFWRLFRGHRDDPEISRLIWGISWFWLVGATFLAQFPALAKQTLHADAPVVSLFLAMFSLGIGAGSLLTPKLLADRPTLRFSGWGLLGMALFAADFALSARPLTGDDSLMRLALFLRQPVAWRLLTDLVLTALSAGLYVVPLYAQLQIRAAPERRARVIAANNILNALFMTAAAGLAALALAQGADVPSLLLVIAAANLALAARRLLRRNTAAPQLNNN